MRLLAFEQFNHNPESPRDALFAANTEHNAPGAKERIEKPSQRLHRSPVKANLFDQWRVAGPSQLGTGETPKLEITIR
jgi:hypothetical protein